MIYIVRHGQTDYNINGRYSGRLDIQLNKKGIEEAKIVKEKLKDIKFDIIYTSPLQRAYQTAKIIRDEDIIKDNRLIERSNGLLEGRLKSEVTDIIDFNNPSESRYNIENIVDFRNRIYDFFDEITKIKNKNILIITHAGVGIYARCYFEGEPKDLDYNMYKLNNCDILIYEN